MSRSRIVNDIYFMVVTAPPLLEGVLETLKAEALAEQPKQNTLKALKEAWDTPAGQQQRVRDALIHATINPLYCTPLLIMATDFEHDELIVKGSLIQPDSDDNQVLSRMLDWLASRYETHRTGRLIGYGIEYHLAALYNSTARANIIWPSCLPGYYGKWFDNESGWATIDAGKLVPTGTWSSSIPALDDALAGLGLPPVAYPIRNGVAVKGLELTELIAEGLPIEELSVLVEGFAKERLEGVHALFERMEI